MPVLHIMTVVDGDKRVKWKRENEKDLEKAKRLFKEKLKEGFLAFGYKVGERKRKIINTFDEAFDRILMIPPPSGGVNLSSLDELKELRKILSTLKKIRMAKTFAENVGKTRREIPPRYYGCMVTDWEQEIQRKMEELQLTIEGAMKEILLEQYLAEEKEK